ncbi:hypothetical protein [Absidia glauca]|uniref:Uncharacterized protein n=1 Tax=Absidia glauca TaxID=4829 RepID=A0A163MT34_ABSGL|nr:hypothetical protein [Absidia glauca]
MMSLHSRLPPSPVEKPGPKMKATVASASATIATTANVELESSTQATIHVNLPSEHLRLLVGNPMKSRRLSALPDETIGTSTSLQQGSKWCTHPLFQHPIMTIRETDYWVGDLIAIHGTDQTTKFLLHRSFVDSDVVMAQGYQVGVVPGSKGADPLCYLQTCLSSVEVSKFGLILFKQIFWAMKCVSMDSGIISPISLHNSLLMYATHPMKKPILDEFGNNTGRYHKVQVIPLMLFTDETSGNISKQYNMYDSWSMVCGALPLEDRNKRSNVHFIGAVASQSGLSAINMAPRLVSDLKMLEKGVLMYSACYGEEVIVRQIPCSLELDEFPDLTEIKSVKAAKKVLNEFGNYTPVHTCVQIWQGFGCASYLLLDTKNAWLPWIRRSGNQAAFSCRFSGNNCTRRTCCLMPTSANALKHLSSPSFGGRYSKSTSAMTETFFCSGKFEGYGKAKKDCPLTKCGDGNDDALGPTKLLPLLFRLLTTWDFEDRMSILERQFAQSLHGAKRRTLGDDLLMDELCDKVNPSLNIIDGNKSLYS